MSNTTTINAFAANQAGGALEAYTYEVGELEPPLARPHPQGLEW